MRRAKYTRSPVWQFKWLNHLYSIIYIYSRKEGAHSIFLLNGNRRFSLVMLKKACLSPAWGWRAIGPHYASWVALTGTMGERRIRLHQLEFAICAMPASQATIFTGLILHPCWKLVLLICPGPDLAHWADIFRRAPQRRRCSTRSTFFTLDTKVSWAMFVQMPLPPAI